MLLLRLNDPAGRVITDFESAKVVHSAALFDAWVPQPSPCCAAAVIAGVLNALTPSKNWRPSGILPYYVAMTDKRIATQKKKLLAMLRREVLTENTLDALTAGMHERLQAVHGIQFGDTSKKAKPRKLTKTLLLGVARECLEDTSLGMPTSIRQAIFPVQEDENRASSTADESTAQLPDGISPSRGSRGVSFDIPFDDERNKQRDAPHWKQCQQELYQYWHLLDGREKLAHPARPSTAICGNAALLFVLETVTEQEPDRVFGTAPGVLHGELFVGRLPGKAVCRIGNEEDSDDTRASVWTHLWTAFSCENTAMVYHMKNHYALIFALREWRSSDGQRHCELLTARRGQRPSCWVSWREAYDTMAAWHGHKILRVTFVIDTKISV